MQFKRGTVISCSYDIECINDKGEKIQTLVVRATDGSEHVFRWIIWNDNDLYGEGDKVSFLFNEDLGLVMNLRLNSFGG